MTVYSETIESMIFFNTLETQSKTTSVKKDILKVWCFLLFGLDFDGCRFSRTCVNEAR